MVTSGQPVWQIQFTPEAERWFTGLGERDADRIAAALGQLERGGPSLAGQCVRRIKGSRHHNMKELRAIGGHQRVLFAFDPHRRAVILLGGDKTNDWKGWYERNIKRADVLYDKHLRSLGKEGAWARGPGRAGGRSAQSGR